MQSSGVADSREDAACSQLEELARRTAQDLLRQGRRFDTVGAQVTREATAAKTGLRQLIGRGLGNSRRSENFRGWRLHSMRLAQTTTTGPAGTDENVSRKDEELWLGALGGLFVLVIRTVIENEKTSVTASSEPVTYRSAARYDYMTAWKTRQTVQGSLLVNDAWLEILGKRKSLKPLDAVSDMLVSLAASTGAPAGLQ